MSSSWLRWVEAAGVALDQAGQLVPKATTSIVHFQQAMWTWCMPEIEKVSVLRPKDSLGSAWWR